MDPKTNELYTQLRCHGEDKVKKFKNQCLQYSDDKKKIFFKSKIITGG